jgi:hypothetical protein
LNALTNTHADHAIRKDNDIDIETTDTDTFQALLSWSVFDDLESTSTTPAAGVAGLRLSFRSCVFEIRLVDGSENDKVVPKILEDVNLFSRILL